MTVEILGLSGLRGGEAEHAAAELLADFTSYPDLTRLLVIDDTAALLEHEAVYKTLLTSMRVGQLLCVAVGPRAGNDRKFRLPGNILQGSRVLWVSDPAGVDWRLAPRAVPVGHPGSAASGLQHLVELLSVDQVFDRVLTVAGQLPAGVASPGLRLAGIDDEMVVFRAALAQAIERISRAGPAAPDEPFTALLDTSAGTSPDGASLAGDGELAGCRERVLGEAAAASEELRRLASAGGRLGRGARGTDQAGVDEHVVAAGAALGKLRDLVVRLFKDASSPGGLSERQRHQLDVAGVRLAAPDQADPDQADPGQGGAGGGPEETAVRRPAVWTAVAEAVRGGDGLPRVIRRLTLTERALGRGGSASYLPAVDDACPPALLQRLAEPPRLRWSRTGARQERAGTWRQDLGLDEATRAAERLASLVTTVADREWSGDAPPGQVSRARIALGEVSRQLTERAAAMGEAAAGNRARRAGRLSERLLPALRDLVLEALAAGVGAGRADGLEVSALARDKTAALLAAWSQHVSKEGVDSPPPFARSPAGGLAGHDLRLSDADELEEIAAAVQTSPREEMWQLCAIADLGLLDVTTPPQVVAFAPRLGRPSLAARLRTDTAWTSSGKHAGLLRLVPLYPEIVTMDWTSGDPRQEPPT